MIALVVYAFIFQKNRIVLLLIGSRPGAIHLKARPDRLDLQLAAQSPRVGIRSVPPRFEAQTDPIKSASVIFYPETETDSSYWSSNRYGSIGFRYSRRPIVEPIHSRHQNTGCADRHPTGNKTRESSVINKRCLITNFTA